LSQETVVTQEQYDLMLSLAKDREFQELLIVTWETGCRPQESLRVEAKHVDLASQRWVIPTTPGKPDNRVVYLTENALAITKRSMVKHRRGPLIRNTDGVPWTTDAGLCGTWQMESTMIGRRVTERQSFLAIGLHSCAPPDSTGVILSRAPF
jgi:integrase